MADATVDLASVGSGFASGMGTVADVIMYIFLGLALVGLVWIYFYIKSFNIKVTIRELVKGRSVLRKDKARIKKDKNGLYYFQLLKAKVKREVPPNSCFDINNKGQKSIELYYVSEDDAYVPIKDEFDYEEYKSKPENFKKLEPFTSTQRIQLMHEFKEAENYKKKKLGEQLLALAPYFILVLILAVFMIFFEQVVTPTKDMAAQMVVVAEKMEKSLEHMENIALEKQRLESETIVKADGVNNNIIPANSNGAVVN